MKRLQHILLPNTECEYPSIVSLLDAFDINELSEIWEVLDREESAERD